MAVKQLYPNQRPTLNLNFARSKTLDPRIEFSRGGCTGTYVGSDGLIKTAAVDEPRFDHNPVTNECRGLLIEESRTNILTYSEDFTNAAWAVDSAGCSITADQATAPDGTTTADALAELVAIDTSRSITWNTTTATGSEFATSVYVKPYGGQQYFGIRAWSANTSYVRCVFDLVNGTVTQELTRQWTAVAGYIEPINNGWFRCKMVATPVSTVNQNLASFLLCDQAEPGNQQKGKVTYDVAATGKGVYIWGAQTEVNASFSTSYIPTSGSTCTRNGDYAKMSGTNVTSWYNIPEGTIYSEGMSPLDLTTSRLVWHFRDPGRKEHNADNGFQWYDAGYGLTNGTTYAAGTINKQAYSYSNVVPGRPCLNGILRPQFIANTSPYAHTTLSLGSNVGTNIFLNGYIQRFAYYPTRLTDSQLQELTS